MSAVANALLRRQAQDSGSPAPNAKRIYRVLKVHGLLLQRHSGKADKRRHDGRVAVDTRKTRWCSDGFQIVCDNGEKVRVAFSLDCCDLEAMGFVASTAGISAEDVRDLMTATVEHRFGRVNRLPATFEWLTGKAVAIPPGKRAASHAKSTSGPGQRPSKPRNPTAWPKPSCAP